MPGPQEETGKQGAFSQAALGLAQETVSSYFQGPARSAFLPPQMDSKVGSDKEEARAHPCSRKPATPHAEEETPHTAPALWIASRRPSAGGGELQTRAELALHTMHTRPRALCNRAQEVGEDPLGGG